jgi:two-component system response regulator
MEKLNFPNSDPIVLHVEDDAAEAALLKRAFEEVIIPHEIRHIDNGEAALDYLFARGDYANASPDSQPRLILLDIYLPGIDGIEVLKQIKNCGDLRHIPVVMLSNSATKNDIAKAYINHANAYVVKLDSYISYREMIRSLGLFWLGMNRSSASPTNVLA